MSEIYVQCKLSATKGNLKVPDDGVGRQGSDFTASDPNIAGGTQAIGFAAHEQITIGDVATAGLMRARNVDDTNFIEIGIDVAATFYPLVKLLPGEEFVFRLATNTFYAQADTAACVLRKVILDA